MRSSRVTLISIGAVFLIGLGLRLASIRSSLWLDEFSTLWSVERGLTDVIKRVPEVMGQTQFYFSLAWASIHAFGESELALRLPSLLAGIVTAVAVALAGALFGGRRAAVWSAGLFWLCYPAIWASVDARPYGLAFCCASITVLGFAGTCLRGRPRDRVLWIGGAAGLVWAHYIFVPFLLGFPAIYAASPALRQRYPIRRFCVDTTLIAVLLLPALPQFLAIASSPHSQQWVFRGSPLAVFGLFLPFSVAAWLPVRRTTRDDVHRDLRRTLWLAVAFQYGALVAAAVVGINLMEPRYAGAVVIAGAILAGDNLARVSGADLVAPLSVYAIVTVLTLAANYQVNGSMSGAGFQQWREAVAALRPEVIRAQGAPVLFRSGNAEDDLGTLGESHWPATFAPLRSPGERAPEWNIALLTYRWNTPGRSEYFEERLAPRIADQPAFFMLCQASSEPGANGYCNSVSAWIEHKWPGRFHAETVGLFRFLTVLRFERTAR